MTAYKNRIEFANDASALTGKIKFHIAMPYAYGLYAKGQSGWMKERIDEDEKNRRLIQLSRENHVAISAIEKIYQEAFDKCCRAIAQELYGIRFFDALDYDMKKDQWTRKSAARHFSAERIEASYDDPDALAALEEDWNDLRWQWDERH